MLCRKLAGTSNEANLRERYGCHMFHLGTTIAKTWATKRNTGLSRASACPAQRSGRRPSVSIRDDPDRGSSASKGNKRQRCEIRQDRETWGATAGARETTLRCPSPVAPSSCRGLCRGLCPLLAGPPAYLGGQLAEWDVFQHPAWGRVEILSRQQPSKGTAFRVVFDQKWEDAGDADGTGEASKPSIRLSGPEDGRCIFQGQKGGVSGRRPRLQRERVRFAPEATSSLSGPPQILCGCFCARKQSHTNIPV